MKYYKAFLKFIVAALAIFGLVMAIFIFIPLPSTATNMLKGMAPKSVLSIVFSSIVALATGVYAVLTKRLVDETIKMRRVETEPKISITSEHRKEWIGFQDLVVKNIGNGPAYDIILEVSEEFHLPGNKNKKLSETTLFEEGIYHLAPSHEIRFFLNTIRDDIENPESFKITVRYSSEESKKQQRDEYKDTYIIDLSLYEGLSKIGQDDLYKIADNLEKIRKELRKVTGSTSRRLDVDLYTSRDRQKEAQRKKKQLKKLKKRSNSDDD